MVGRGLVFDWVSVLVLFLLGVLMNALLEPRIMPVDLSSPDVTHSHLPDIVTGRAELIGSIALPALGFFLTEGWTGMHSRVFHIYMLGLIESGTVNIVITDVLKLVAGRPRPYFAEVCVNYEDGDETQTKCTGDRGLVREGRKSFPSGHSSLAFAVATYWTLFWLRRGKLSSQIPISPPFSTLETMARDPETRLWRLLVTLMPMFGAALVAVSRVIDYHHNWSDITAGSALGTMVGSIGYLNREASLIASQLTSQPPPPRAVDLEEEEKRELVLP